MHSFFSNSFYILLGFIIIFVCDSFLVDDEPLLEPIEWSVWQTALMFIFLFAWVAEVSISSRFGSFTGRDKRVWTALFKAYWFSEFYLMLSIVLLAIFGIVPFYFEQVAPTANWVSFWLWYDKIFLWKSLNYIFIILFFLYNIQLVNRWNSTYMINWLFFIIFILTAVLLYNNVLTLSLLYFTNPTTYNLHLGIDYSQLSHTPNKWGWGPKTRDHFSYHNTPTVYWMKYDIPYISVLIFLNVFYTLSVFLLFVQIIIIMRKIYTMWEISYTTITYISNMYRTYFYLLSCSFGFSIISFIFIILRNPTDILTL